jgi:hypothetical protein
MSVVLPSCIEGIYHRVDRCTTTTAAATTTTTTTTTTTNNNNNNNNTAYKYEFILKIYW